MDGEVKQIATSIIIMLTKYTKCAKGVTKPTGVSERLRVIRNFPESFLWNVKRFIKCGLEQMKKCVSRKFT